MSAAPPPPARPPGRRAWVVLAFVVPALCCAAAIAVRPADRLGAPDELPWIDQLLYDDYDFAAFALRGLNSKLGREAGRQEAPGLLSDDEYAVTLQDSRPLESRYYLEYPHAALLLFRVPFAFEPVPPAAPAALLDGAHESIVIHTPRDDEAAVWKSFHRAVLFYALMMVAFYAALVAVLAAGYLPGGGLGYRGFLLILPGVVFFSLYRFDVVPALLTALSFALLGRGRVTASAVSLALGTLVKVYPIFLAPLVVRHLLTTRSPRAAAGWAVAFGVTLAAFLGPAVAVWGSGQVAAPYLVQLSRKPEGMNAYQYLIPNDELRAVLAGNGPVGRGFRLGTLALVSALLLVRPIPDLAGVLRRGAVVLITFMSLSVFYSPQWILWLVPLLLPLAGRHRRLVVLAAALDLVTWCQWPLTARMIELFGLQDWPDTADIVSSWGLSLSAGDVLLTALTYARLVLLGLIVWNVLRADRSPGPAPAPLPSPSPALA
jgi:hypothetical protein